MDHPNRDGTAHLVQETHLVPANSAEEAALKACLMLYRHAPLGLLTVGTPRGDVHRVDLRQRAAAGIVNLNGVCCLNQDRCC